MTFKVKGSIESVDSILNGGVVFDKEKIPNSKEVSEGKFTVEHLDDSTPQDLAEDTLVANFGFNDNSSGQLSFNTGDWRDSNEAPVKLMMRVTNNDNDSDWVTIFDSSKTTVTWTTIATAGQTSVTVPNLDFKQAVIFINGVFQHPDTSYTTNGGTIIFAEALEVGDELFIEVGTNSDSTLIKSFSTQIEEPSNELTLPEEYTSEMIFINGVYQYPGSYAISSSTVTFNTSLETGDDVYVFGDIEIENTEGFVISEETDTITVLGTLDEPYVFINGILQNNFEITDSTITFPGELSVDDEVLVINSKPQLMDTITTTYISTVKDRSASFNIPYFSFTEMQVFVNGILQNPETGAYIVNGTEITFSSGLQALDVVYVIVYNSPVKREGYATKLDLESYLPVLDHITLTENLKNEGIDFSYSAHLPSVEVSFGLPKGSLRKWMVGYTSVNGDYWLYRDGSVYYGTGTLGITPEGFTKLETYKSTQTYTYSATTQTSTVTVPFDFSNITVFVNGILLSKELQDYTVNVTTITLSKPLAIGDSLVAMTSKVHILQDGNYATRDDLNLYLLKAEFINPDGDLDLRSNTGRENIFSSGENIMYRMSTTSLLPETDNNKILGNYNKRFSSTYSSKFMFDQFTGIFTGNGSPEGVISANVGSLYTDKSGSNGSVLYVKESGTGNTGWVAK